MQEQDRRSDKSTPESDSTSKETLEDIAESEVDTSTGDSQSAPSPDGVFDESGEAKDDGPM
jgi:hypothetical protein